MNDATIACSFPLDTEDPSRLKSYSSSLECRESLRCEPSSVQVIVGDGGEVSPINLAAALCLDSPERDVYLVSDAPSAAFVSRARAAGVREVVKRAQAEQMLGFLAARPLPEKTPDNPSGTSHAIFADDPALALALRQAGCRESLLVETGGSSQSILVGIFAGRGGVGKSAVALMLSILASKRGLRAAIVDLDLQFGDISYLAGRDDRGSLRKLPLTDLVSNAGGGVCGALEVSPGELLVVEAPGKPEQAELLMPHIPGLLNELEAVCDLVVVNTSSFFNGLHAEIAHQCSHLIFLMDQRSTSVTACKQAMELCVRLQIPQARFLFALNGCGRYAALGVQDVSLALGGMEVCELADGGALVDELLALGCPGELAVSGNAFIASLDMLLDRLTSGFLLLGAPDSRARREKIPVAQQKAKGLGGKLSGLAALFSGRERLGHVAS